MDDIITALLPLLGDASLATMAPLAILVTVVLRVWTIKWVRDKAFGWVAKLPKNMQPVAPCVLRAASGHTITLKNSGGNIQNLASDLVLNSAYDRIEVLGVSGGNVVVTWHVP